MVNKRRLILTLKCKVTTLLALVVRTPLKMDAGRRMVLILVVMNAMTLVLVVRKLVRNRWKRLRVLAVFVLYWMCNGRLTRSLMMCGAYMWRRGIVLVSLLLMTRRRIVNRMNDLGPVLVRCLMNVTRRLVLG